jgi:hypothetical protein
MTVGEAEDDLRHQNKKRKHKYMGILKGSKDTHRHIHALFHKNRSPTERAALELSVLYYKYVLRLNYVRRLSTKNCISGHETHQMSQTFPELNWAKNTASTDDSRQYTHDTRAHFNQPVYIAHRYR